MNADPDDPAQRPEPARPDLPLLDALRLLASFAVVHHHMRGESLFGVGFGLPLFLVVLLGLASSSSKQETPVRFARRKASYLLVPWLRWSLVYVAMLAASDALRGRDVWDRFGPGMLFAGGEPSLWFLPFAAAAMLPMRGLARAAERIAPVPAAWIAAAAAAAATFAAAGAMELPLPDMPVRAWLRVAPALLWGLALGQSVRARASAERGRVLLPCVAFATAGLLVAPHVASVEDLPLRFGVAVLLACVGFGVPFAVPRIVRRLSACTFGIYLVHPLIGKALGAAFDVFAWPAWVHASVAWMLALAAIRALRALGLPWHELSSSRQAAATPLDSASPGARPARKRAA